MIEKYTENYSNNIKNRCDVRSSSKLPTESKNSNTYLPLVYSEQEIRKTCSYYRILQVPTTQLDAHIYECWPEIRLTHGCCPWNVFYIIFDIYILVYTSILKKLKYTPALKSNILSKLIFASCVWYSDRVAFRVNRVMMLGSLCAETIQHVSEGDKKWQLWKEMHEFIKWIL